MTIQRVFLGAAALVRLLGAGTVFAEPPRTGTRSVALSLAGSADRYGDYRSEEVRTGAEFECASELKFGRSALDWNLELYYDYFRSETGGTVSNSNSAGLDLAKILLSRWRGTKLETLKPYLLAGAELTLLEETDADGGETSSIFLSPTAGLGLELKLNSRASFNVEYRRNFSGGSRRIYGLTLGFSYAVFGAGEETAEEEKDGPEAGGP